jgi:anti-sigma factor (TIGR02949 family)
MGCDDARELLQGYLDNELDAAHAMQVARHQETCEACRSAYADALQLRSAVRNNARRYRAPVQLRMRILAATGGAKSETRERSWWRAQGWLSLGASFAVAVLMTWGLTYYFAKPAASDLLMDQALATHIRGVLSDRLIDVASSDRHTVKPWLSARLDYSPPVADFADNGFALVGGRLDYLDGRPIAALLYQHKKHVISVFVWPDASVSQTKPGRESKNGYNVAHWTRAGFRYYVVSDLEGAQLARLVTLLQAAEPDPTR